MVRLIKNDKGYHMRIHSDESYIFYGDCDWFRGTFKEFAKLLIDFLSKRYKIQIQEDEISYTENEMCSMHSGWTYMISGRINETI